MSDEKALAKVPDIMTLGNVFAKSGYFQDARDAAQAVVKMLAGQELGFGPVASMTGIYIVKGRVTLSANLIAAAVKKGGKYNYRVTELTDAVCKITFYEGKEAIGESSFTMEDAKAAGLVNDNYKKFARNMLFARAMSNGAKWYCADVTGGPTYTPDELGAVVDMETGEMLTRPADEKILPLPVGTKVQTPTGEVGTVVASGVMPLSADELFSIPAEDEVRLLKANVIRGFLKLGYDTEAQTAAIKAACHATMLDDVTEPALLNDLLKELRKVWEAKKGPKRGEL